MPQPQQPNQIPNNQFETSHALLRWNAALEGGQELVRRGVVSRRFAVWAVRVAHASTGQPDERFMLVGTGPGPVLPVDAERVEDAVYALADLGAIDETFEGDAVQPPDIGAFNRLLAATGDPGPPPFGVAEHESGKVDFEALLIAFYLLRRMWLISVALQEHADPGEAAGLLRACITSTGIGAGIPMPPAGDHVAWLRLIRSWGAHVVAQFCFTTASELDEKKGRYILVPAPTTPLQLLAITLGVSLGAVDAGVPGVYVCEYKACVRRVFVADRSGVKGAHVFCSSRCGKRYWSTVDTYRKRAAKKAQSKPTGAD